jgi:hypothetical protein
MRRTVCIAFLLIKLLSYSFSQTNKSIVAENLFSYNQAVATISSEEFKYLTPESADKENISGYRQNLIRNNKGLFVVIVGTGRLYKAFPKDGTTTFERVDSTVYFGDNFRSFNFSYKDTIYSLGGYGFWKTNGLLKYFVEKRNEWEIIKLNKEIPIITENGFDLIWYDQPDGKLYFGFTKEENNTTTNEKSQINFHYKTTVLDLNKKEWSTLGTLTTFLKDNLNNTTNITSSPWGQMISSNNKILFLNYKENTIYQLKPNKQRIIEEFPTSSGDSHACYFKDSVFFSGISSKNLLDSTPLSKNDMILINEKIYIPGDSGTNPDIKLAKNNSLNVFIILGTLLLAFTVAFYLVKRKNKKLIPSETEKVHITSNKIFTGPEIEVLKTIVENSKKGSATSIDELNKVLGVGKKSSEVQKKQRSDVISSINRKYSYIKDGNGELITRKQAEFDKRSFEYYIGFDKLADIQTWI